MEKLLEGIDMGELQKGIMSDPNMRQTVQEVLKNPEALSEFKNFFAGGSKWRKKHTRNRKKRGSGGTHSSTRKTTAKHQKDYAKKVDKSFKNFPFATSSTTAEEDESEHTYPLKPMSIFGEKKRRGAIVDLMEKSPLGALPHREAAEEKIHRLRKEAEDFKKALLEKEEKDIKEKKKVMFGGKRKKRRSRRRSRRKSRRKSRRRRRKRKRTRRKRR